MRINVTEKHLAVARDLVRETHEHGGLAPVDLDRFWADQALAGADPFGRNIPQVPMATYCNWECVFEEMGIPQDWKRWNDDPQWRLELSRAYNVKAEKIVGRKLLDETPPAPAGPAWPAVKELHDIFEMENRWDDISQSWWWHQAASTQTELAALLDRVEKRLENLREFLLPPTWDSCRQKLLAAGIKPPLYRGQRGPVTLACSMLGVENLIFLILDNPALAARLRDVMLRAMIEKGRVQDEEAGFTPATAPHGFGFADDNCMMLTAEMYEFFALPIVQGIWARYSPEPADGRYQHSDSAMGHIVPVLARCNMTGVNFGPTVMVDHIRRHMPTTVIHGQLAPFTFSRNDEMGIVAEFLRDYELIADTRGLLFATAGSINNGSRLTGMRLIMSAIQRYGRYA
ncbi:MAG: uroporphyrinogen decarboxylase family protein [Planctomycetaceae bacterium]|nr:uroporphyrinogen decarboxylase family protein [Planctomycetaceae bacterium]